MSLQSRSVVSPTDTSVPVGRNLATSAPAPVRLLVVSRGPDGCWFTTGAASGHAPGYAVKVAETTGAGDGFVAALVSQLLGEIESPAGIAHLPPERLAAICDFANAVGALTTTRVGAIPALPTLAEAQAFHEERQG